MMKHFIRDYFTFSKKERIAAIVLIVIITVFIFLPNFFSVKKEKVIVDDDTKQKILSQQQKKSFYKNYQKNYDNETDYYNNNGETNANSIILFEFDPNTLDVNGWRKLGLREKTINTILNYVSKGGKFKQPDDIRKIWGLRQDEADRLIPYIKINNTTTSYSKNVQPQNKTTNNTEVFLDINTATVEQLKTIPNIGNQLPYKMVSFREKLGGFVYMAQVKETYGMTDSIFQKILPYLHLQHIEIRKLNLNTATEYEFNAHPYIDKTLSKALVIYRTQHGGYKLVTDVRKIVFLTEDIFKKIEPYLKVE